MLLNATVNQLKCAFVKATYDYFYCKTYSLDCCTTDAEELFRLYKLTQVPCDLTPELECTLNEFNVVDYTVDCSDFTPPIPCADQLPYTITTTTTPMQLYVHVLNIVNGSTKVVYPINDDTIDHYGSIWVVLTNSAKITTDGTTFVVPNSYTIYDSQEVLTSAMLSATHVTIPVNWFTFNTSYLKTVHLAKTNSSGSYVGGFEVVDVDPATSPYLTCTGCTTVNPAHLVFGHSNWPTAIENVLKNAVLTIDGNVNFIRPDAFKAGNQNATSPASAGQLYLWTYMRKNPATIHYGLKNLGGSYVSWYNQFTTLVETTPSGLVGGSGNAGILPATTVILTGPDGDIEVDVSQLVASCTASHNGDFNTSSFSSPVYSNQSVTHVVNGSLALTDTFTITVTVSTTNPYSISITNADDDFLAGSIAQTLVYSTTLPGTYTITVTGPNGCILTEDITLP